MPHTGMRIMKSADTKLKTTKLRMVCVFPTTAEVMMAVVNFSPHRTAQNHQFDLVKATKRSPWVSRNFSAFGLSVGFTYLRQDVQCYGEAVAESNDRYRWCERMQCASAVHACVHARSCLAVCSAPAEYIDPAGVPLHLQVRVRAWLLCEHHNVLLQIFPGGPALIFRFHLIL
jgi:hypothetical protein